MVGFWLFNQEVPVVLTIFFVKRLIFIGRVYIDSEKKKSVLLLYRPSLIVRYQGLLFSLAFLVLLAYKLVLCTSKLHLLTLAILQHLGFMSVNVSHKMITMKMLTLKKSEIFKASRGLKYKVEVLRIWPSTK